MLLIYWPGLFVLTHIPIPQLARQSGMSDKMMHALAYLALVFLWWFSISPYIYSAGGCQMDRSGAGCACCFVGRR